MSIGADRQREYRKRRRIKAIEYLGGVCSHCGSTNGLQFDHKDPTSKQLEISRAIISAWSWERLSFELDKCQLLCYEHHLEKSKIEGSLGGIPWNKIVNPRHGTSVMYSRPYRCRCAECKQFKRLYRAKLVDARGVRLPS